MTITPLAAAAVPAGIAAIKLARHVHQNQPFRHLLAQLVPAGEDAEATSPDSASEDELQAFQSLVAERLSAAGIHTSIRFTISSDAAGRLRVSDNHPRGWKIERALADDPDVAAAFERLAAAYRQNQAGQQRLDFAAQYVANSSAASLAAPPADGEFSVTINGDEIEID